MAQYSPNKLPQIGPNRASLLHIGHDSLQGDRSNPDHKTVRDETRYVSPILLLISDIRGQSLPFWLLENLAGAAASILIISCIKRDGGADLMSGCTLCQLFSGFLTNQLFTAKKALKGNKIPLTGTIDTDELSVSSVNYCRLKGLEHLATAQEKDAQSHKLKIEPENSLRVFKDKVVKATLKEAVVYGLAGCPITICAFVSLYKGFMRGESAMFLFGSATCVWHSAVVNTAFAQTAFTIRFSQKLSEFEIRRYVYMSSSPRRTLRLIPLTLRLTL